MSLSQQTKKMNKNPIGSSLVILNILVSQDINIYTIFQLFCLTVPATPGDNRCVYPEGEVTGPLPPFYPRRLRL